MSKIKSKNSLFRCQLIEKPKRAKVIYSADGEPLFICPHCGHTASEEECDCLGAEPDCMFCNQCNREFQAE